MLPQLLRNMDVAGWEKMERLTAFSWILLAMLLLGGVSVSAQDASSGEQSEKILETIEKLPQDPTAVVAVVGDEHLLLADVTSQVDAQIDAALAAKNATRAQLPEGYREVMIRRGLVELIKVKMLFHGFLNSAVGGAKPEDFADATKQVRSKGRQHFLATEFEALKEKYQVQTPAEVDQKLRETGTTLARREAVFIDSIVAMTFLGNEVPREPEISHAEIIRYYRQHTEEFRQPARARWEQLTILFSRIPDRQQAWDAIGELGREAYYGGSMQGVARRGSHGPFAGNGGVHDWTRKGALASESLDEAIFSLPIGVMSQRIEDDLGYHIVKVLEREDARTLSLPEAEEEIRKKLQQEKRTELEEAFFAKIRESVPIWTIFPEDVPGSLPLEHITSLGRATRR